MHEQKKAAARLESATQWDPNSAEEQRDKSLHAPRRRLSQAVARRGLNLPAVRSSLAGTLTTSWGSASLRGGEEHSDAKSCVNTVALLPSLLLLFLLPFYLHPPPPPPPHLWLTLLLLLPAAPLRSSQRTTSSSQEGRQRREGGGGVGEGKQAFPHVADPLPHSIHLPAEAFILFSWPSLCPVAPRLPLCYATGSGKYSSDERFKRDIW